MKAKSHSSIKKRVKRTGTGKIKISKSARNHLLLQKSKRQKNMGKHLLDISPGFAKKVKRTLHQ